MSLRRIVLESRRFLAEMPHWDFPGKEFPEFSGTIDFQVEKYPVSPDEKRLLNRAFFTSGFVGHTAKRGWMFFSSGAGGRDEMRAATPHEVRTLPHLPDGWEHLARRA